MLIHQTVCVILDNTHPLVNGNTIMTVFVLYVGEWLLTNLAFFGTKGWSFSQDQACLYCCADLHIFCGMQIHIFYPLCEFWHYVYSNPECALWGKSATTLQSACLHSRLGGESTHYEPRRRAPQRSNWASSVEYRAEAAIQSIKLLCGFKAQKRYKHWPGHMHRHAQAAQWHGDTDTHTPTHTRHAHLVAAQGWWKRKGIDFHWLSLWGEK